MIEGYHSLIESKAKIVDAAASQPPRVIKACKWMEEENPHLGGMAPITLVENEEGAARVIDYIERYIALNCINPC